MTLFPGSAMSQVLSYPRLVRVPSPRLPVQTISDSKSCNFPMACLLVGIYVYMYTRIRQTRILPLTFNDADRHSCDDAIRNCDKPSPRYPHGARCAGQ